MQRLKGANCHHKYTTRETVMKFGEHMRLRSVLRGVKEPYRYEKEVEDFLRWSPSVRDRMDFERPPRYFPPAPHAAPVGGEPASPRR